MMKVYINDMLVQGLLAKEYLKTFRRSFDMLWKYRMKLNQLKYSFGVKSKNFLEYMVNQWGIEPNYDKIQAIIKMQFSSKSKEYET